MAEGYLSRSDDDLLAELHRLVMGDTGLAGQHASLADKELRFRRKYWQAWQQQDPSLSAVARSKNSEAAAIEFLAEVLQGRGELCATYEKVNLVRDLLTARGILSGSERRSPLVFPPSVGFADLTGF